MGIHTPGFEPVDMVEQVIQTSETRKRDRFLFGRNGAIKRLMDITISASAIIFMAPLFIAVALCVRLTSAGPVIYRQTRIGRGGKHFAMFKFRTMYQDSEKLLLERLEQCEESAEQWKTFQKLEHDPRVTPIGAFLRKSSLDEIPQLFNVLFGTMSAVSQRPLQPEQKDMYGAASFAHYVRSRPGITGLWQVSGRNRLPFERRAELDTEYSQRWSLAYDIKLLFKTIPVVLFPKGAF